MAELLKGIAVSKEILQGIAGALADLKMAGIHPRLQIFRIGERPDDIAYENSVSKRCTNAEIICEKTVFTEHSSTADVVDALRLAGNDAAIHGILLFRPLPKEFDEQAVLDALHPAKDVDGITLSSMAAVYSGSGTGFTPCTAQACIEILKYYGIPVSGKKVAVIGRSLVIGKPVTMLLLRENATVTVCHTRTADLKSACLEADIVVAAAGRAGLIHRDFLRDGQTVIDVGMNVDSKGNLCGDVDPTALDDLAIQLTPVPGGVGSVTTAVLLRHTVDAAYRQSNIRMG